MRSAAFIISCMAGVALMASCKNNGNDKNAKKDSTVAAAPSKPVPGTPIKYDSSKRYIFLTWDDAPQPPGTNLCKNLFHQEGVKATFFAVGMHQAVAPNRKWIMDSLRNSYPEFLVANHSSTHAFRDNYKMFYTHPDSAVQDFLKAQQDLLIPLKIIRLPGNNSWVGGGEMRGPKSTMQVCKRLDSLGYKVIGWDVEWQFIGGNKPKQSVDAMIAEINRKFDIGYTNQPNTMVVLAHDRMFAKQEYLDSLKRFIQVLKQDPRNVFETIDHYPTVQQAK